jgi:deazaflavin-dependent oxidoreductase (nitroreductase family)
MTDSLARAGSQTPATDPLGESHRIISGWHTGRGGRPSWNKTEMTINRDKIERSVFRRLNAVVEPAVRRGIGSPTLSPASLIVLETVGFKSGEQRRTPLWSICLGPYRIVSTVRGDRSLWVKNLIKQPRVKYYLGGRPRESDAFVIARGTTAQQTPALHPLMSRLTNLLSRLAQAGWTFAILVPIKK